MKIHSPPTDCRHTVSGSFSLPSRGAFHLSLTVLVHYRSPDQYLALEGGPPRFPRGFTCPVVLRCLLSSYRVFIYEAFTLCGGPFQAASINSTVTVVDLQLYQAGPTTPIKQRLYAYT